MKKINNSTYKDVEKNELLYTVVEMEIRMEGP
jgi:hypothetical protein